MNHFFVNQDVVCIDAKQPANTTLPSELTEGQTYKIRWIGIHRHYLEGEYVGVRLEGIDRGTCPIWGDVDTPFRADRFRPLVSDPLAQFRQIATDPSYKVTGPEGPVRDEPLPDDGEGVREKEKEGVE